MMRPFILGVAALVVGVALASTASAGNPHGYYGHGYVRTYTSSRPYYLHAGRPYGTSYYYPGREHYHWESRVWNAQYGRYHYYDPYLRCSFYYCPQRCGYYPVP